MNRLTSSQIETTKARMRENGAGMVRMGEDSPFCSLEYLFGGLQLCRPVRFYIMAQRRNNNRQVCRGGGWLPEEWTGRVTRHLKTSKPGPLDGKG